MTEGTNAYISAKVDKTVDLGTHMMFIGEVTEMKTLSDVPSATYCYYQEHIKPKPQPSSDVQNGHTVWRCKVCGYEYVGDELPDGFVCPSASIRHLILRKLRLPTVWPTSPQISIRN